MKLLFLDTETTGLEPGKHGVVQIAGIIEIDGVVKEEFDFLCRPFDGQLYEARALEMDEILAYHLEQAHRYLGELGPLDDNGLAIGADAARRLGEAGERAVELGFKLEEFVVGAAGMTVQVKICGLSTAEVARAFLVSESTMAARITRAKKKITTARISYRVPTTEELPARAAA